MGLFYYEVLSINKIKYLIKYIVKKILVYINLLSLIKSKNLY